MHSLILTASLLLVLHDFTTTMTSATITKTKRRKDYENALPRQLGLGYAQSVIKVAKAGTVFGTSLWRLRPACYGVPFINADFMAEFRDGSYNGRSNAPKLPTCDSPALLDQLNCPPLLNNSRGLARLEEYKATYLKNISANGVDLRVFSSQRIQRRLETLRGQVRVVDEVIVLWEGPRFTGRVFVVMDACDSSLIHIFNLLALGSIEDSSSSSSLPANRQRRASLVKRSADSRPCSPACPQGQGGNEALGTVQFGPGPDQVCLDATVRKGQFCLENQYVVIHDSRDRPSPTTPCQDIPVVCFDCQSQGPGDSINGAKSPSYDAIYAIGVIRNVINEWYPEIAADLMEPLHVCTHFGQNYTNSAWTGQSILLGDGLPGKAHPFSTLDAIAHEYGHYLTEAYSRLLLQDQVGGVQDAFSDGFAKVVDAFMNGGSKVRSWEVGSGILTGRRPRPIRYMDRPSKDGGSIELASDIRPGMDSHFACGVFNKFFYCMVQVKGVSVRETFLLYLVANKIRWDVNVNFTEAACHVLHTAYDLGIHTFKVATCFQSVGALTSYSQCPLLRAVRTLCANGYVTVQASLTRQPYFRVCSKASSRSFRIYLLSKAWISLSRDSPYSPKNHYTTSCGGILTYTGSLDGNIFIRIAGNSDSLQTVRFAIRFGSGGSRERSSSRGRSSSSRSVDVDRKKSRPVSTSKGD